MTDGGAGPELGTDDDRVRGGDRIDRGTLVGAGGIVLFDKPAGITSHDVVAGVRRARRGTRVGHSGTLDPFATGLLLILLGRATKVQRFLMALPKRYEVMARFGAISSTGDPDGEITETGVVPHGDLELPTGLVRQRPPAFSAVRVGGRRAYALARAGVEVELPERQVNVSRFEELSREADQRRFAIECSSGTYVRSLIADLGDAYCVRLRRTAIGPFDVRDADPELVITLNDALAFLPEVRLAPEHARLARHGAAVPDEGSGVGGGSLTVPTAGGAGGSRVVRLTDEHGLLALGQAVAGDCATLKPIVALRLAAPAPHA